MSAYFDGFMIDKNLLSAFETISKISDSDNLRTIRQTMDGIQRLVDENIDYVKTIESIRKVANTIASPLSESSASMRNIVETMTMAAKSIGDFYSQNGWTLQLLQNEYSKTVETWKTISSLISDNVEQLDWIGMKNILASYRDISFDLEKAISDFSFHDFQAEEVSDEAVAEEVKKIINERKVTFSEKWDKVQKTIWFKAIMIIFTLISFIMNPVKDYLGDNIRNKMGITQFWEDSGIYGVIDKLLGITEDTSVSEEEAKTTVDETELGNISKQKRDDLLKKIKQIRSYISSAPQDQNTDNLLAYISELEKEVFGKKYGLVYEEHRELIDSVLENYTPVLTEKEDLFIDNGGQINFLIEGDNLASLQLLEKTHRGRIDFIYIDPPYNTGSTDFRYSDDIVSKEDGFRHSKWLSFMKKRLLIASELLAEDGLIFISIDNIELASLKLLCDEVFGMENFIETIVWKNKYGAGAKTIGFISVHEYILCYSKKPIGDLTSELDEEAQKAYKMKDEKFDNRGGYLTQPLMTTSLGDRPNLVYDIEYNGDTISPRKQWVWSKERLEEAIKNNEVVFNKQKDGTYSVRVKKYLYDENGNIRRGKPLSIYNGPFTQDGTKEIREIFGSEEAFKFAKPSELIRKLVAFEINGNVKKDAIILDFFAGSGTTAHAVIEQNLRDNGKRSFILCTNNENSICRDITYKRIKTVIENKNCKASLKYYQVAYIPIADKMYYEFADELLLHIQELVELENGINFSGNEKIAIVLTEEELQGFIDNIEDFSKCRKLYMGHDLLPSEEQAEALKAQGIEICIIPDYYYRDLQGD